MTPPDDRSGQYGVPYPGTGHDAFGAPGVGHGQPYGQPYDQQQYGQPYPQEQYGNGQYGRQPSYDAPPPGYPAPGGTTGHLRGRHSAPGPQHGRHGPGQHGPGQVPAQDPGYVEEFEDDYDSGPLIRPFAMTGGRTRPRYELALEALVSANVDPQRLATLLPEHQRICTLCTEVKSVAEVSALLSLPLGVARILVADLAEAGLVAIHQPASGGESGNQPDVTLLERVLSGLRKL
ncbi:DUF742 domain-containing protein [Kitasatospora sp. NPDC091207]|uniref:DUF742 domain-containing protein n=1 Tax=Kitasatospora sp. NPDC091207 TaxID=3364083 RepID=UPI003830CDC5